MITHYDYGMCAARECIMGRVLKRDSAFFGNNQIVQYDPARPAFISLHILIAKFKQVVSLYFA